MGKTGNLSDSDRDLVVRAGRVGLGFSHWLDHLQGLQRRSQKLKLSIEGQLFKRRMGRLV